MSSCNIRKLKSIFTSNGGCGCRQKATDIIEPKPKSNPSFSDQKLSHCPSLSDSSWERHGGDEDYTSTTFSLNIDTSPGPTCPEQHGHAKSSKTVSAAACPKIHDSLAVVKDSDDPYRDFRQSMLQMIFEKEIYSRNDLQQLLDCFLQLNSPHHHEIIVRAFMEIWNGGIAAADGGGETAASVVPVGSCEKLDNNW